jgi:DNA repair protein RecO (recombination protein O)
MLITTQSLVLNAIRYQEKGLIVSCYTRSHGIKKFFIASAFSSGKSGNKSAYFQPLTLLETQINFKNKGALEHFKEIRIGTPYANIPFDIHKSSIALFLSEVLYHSIKENEPDEALFDFLETALIWLDTHDDVLNFHLIILYKITKFLGFYPNINPEQGRYFDLQNGTFSNEKNYHSLNEAESELFVQLSTLNFDENSPHLTGINRRTLLKILMDYYALHIDGFKKPKSLDILKEVLS